MVEQVPISNALHAVRASRSNRVPVSDWPPAVAHLEAGRRLTELVPTAPVQSRSIQSAEGLRQHAFVATLAHEIRQPLSALRSAVELLSQTGQSPENFDRTTGAMRRQILQLDRLVEDIMDAARLWQGKVTLRRRRVDLGEIIRDVVLDVMPQVTARRQQLTVCVRNAPLWIDADAQRMHQVVSNLAGNAIKYSAPGGQIILTAESRTGVVTISVCDNGRGIAPENLPRIFDLFSQAESSDAASLGLGLSVVREIVQLHGGWIEARSAGTSRGTEFVVTLPAAVESIEGLAPFSGSLVHRAPLFGSPTSAPLAILTA
jgi:signal transduction histidine kinase